MFLVNGTHSETLSLHDRALQYGDGLFETLAVLNGTPLLWDRHMSRLQRGCAVLGIPAPSPGLLREEAASLCRGRDRQVLKIIISRGQG
ncbi:MAG: aminotransferase class IV, partial [Gammaproteobacteria bacterium]